MSDAAFDIETPRAPVRPGDDGSPKQTFISSGGNFTYFRQRVSPSRPLEEQEEAARDKGKTKGFNIRVGLEFLSTMAVGETSERPAVGRYSCSSGGGCCWLCSSG
jgi:hypothetical protein